ncbi:MAG: hypothetical protein JRI80_19530 [Deltaproteobacteria bacterium]|nr:hypothetical protein [Deltaproteobacteria bacterium]
MGIAKDLLNSIQESNDMVKAEDIEGINDKNIRDLQNFWGKKQYYRVLKSGPTLMLEIVGKKAFRVDATALKNLQSMDIISVGTIQSRDLIFRLENK